MAILLNNCLILHIPKTGSSWLRAACKAAVRGRVEDLGTWHLLLAGSRQELKGKLPPTGTFVRHPLDWYVSAWTYWRKVGTFIRPPNGPIVEHDDFEQTLRNCMTAEPSGYVSCLYEAYTGRHSDEIDFIGRQESLTDDLVNFLNSCNEDFDEQKLRDTKPVNIHGRRSDAGRKLYSPELAEEVMRYEHRAISRYGFAPVSEYFDGKSETVLY